MKDFVKRSTSFRLLFQQVGQWRTNLIWRLFGLMIVNLSILRFGQTYSHWHLISTKPLSHHLLLLSGIALMMGGARLITLIAATVGMSWSVIPICLGIGQHSQVADEYIVFIVLPMMGAVLTALYAYHPSFKSSSLEQSDHRAIVDEAHMGMFRISIIVAMTFACLHKVNADFMNPDCSCGPILARYLNRDWNINFPDFLTNPTPVTVLVGEGLIPVMLFLYPRLGILITICVIGPIGHIGPVTFTMTVVLTSFSFFRHEDGEIILRNIKKYLYIYLPLFVLLIKFSLELFQGRKPWTKFMLFEWILTSGLFCILILAGSFIRRCLKERNRNCLRELIPNIKLKLLFTKNKIFRTALIIFCLLSIVNGLSPYLGLKYRLSYAMLSNLRADDTRWNSYIFPRWLSLRKNDAYIHVTKVSLSYEDRMKVYDSLGSSWSDYRMSEGLMAPWSFKRRLKRHMRHDIQMDLALEYNGKKMEFKDATRHKGIEKWMNSLPDHKLFQSFLSLNGPQRCIH